MLSAPIALDWVGFNSYDNQVMTNHNFQSHYLLYQPGRAHDREGVGPEREKSLKMQYNLQRIVLYINPYLNI